MENKSNEETTVSYLEQDKEMKFSFVNVKAEFSADNDLIDSFEDEDPLQPKIYAVVKIEAKEEKLSDSEENSSKEKDASNSVYCAVCKKTSQVTNGTFRKQLGSFCDKCYWYLRIKYFNEWMEKKKQYNKSCFVCINSEIHSPNCNGENAYSCHICYKSFNQAGLLKDHVQRVHSGEKPHSCDICKTSFSRLINLKTHIRVHTGEKPHSCAICKKSFNHSSHLKTHLRIHSGEKPYFCEICKNSFSKLINLKSHSRIHSGEKPYSCEICKKSFTQASQLNTHSRSHSNIKPHSCKICDKSFRLPHHLRTHLRVHGGKK